MKTNEIKIDEFVNLSIEAFESDNDLIFEYLNISESDYLNERLKNIKKMKFKYKALYNKQKNEILLKRAIERAQEIICSSNINLKEELASLIHSRSPQFQFRNLEKLDNNDLAELLSDLDVIEIIEELDNRENDK